MILFICPGCGRFGSLDAPEGDVVEVECPYCGDTDMDWMSRPDLDNPKAGPAVDGLLRSTENLVLRIMKRAYGVYDEDADTKEAALHEFEDKLYDLFDKFTQ